VHVIQYILLNGNRPSSNESRDDWPLITSRKSSDLRRSYHEIVETTDPINGLLDELLSDGCINIRHKDFIETHTSHVAKNENLLFILFRRSVSDFRKFINCLEKTKQHQIVSLLKAGVTRNNRPLADENKKKVLANYSVLISLIDVRQGLLSELNCFLWTVSRGVTTNSSKARPLSQTATNGCWT
jgi:hypothetical protein